MRVPDKSRDCSKRHAIDHVSSLLSAFLKIVQILRVILCVQALTNQNCRAIINTCLVVSAQFMSIYKQRLQDRTVCLFDLNLEKS